MESLHQFAIFAAPLITTLIAFLLNKYLQNKPKLIAYWGHTSSHKMPFNTGYFVYSLALNTKPNQILLDRQYKDKVPVIIKSGDDLWVYGHDINRNTQLVQLENKELYNSIEFKDEISLINKVSEDIYNDILSANAHDSKMYIGTHSVVIRNGGRLPARNVRIGHTFLPDYNSIPSIDFQVANLPGGSKELLIPIMIPGEQITISYMYFAPTSYKDVNSYIKSDEGFAKWITVIPAPNLAIWQKIFLFILIFIGSSALIYFGIMLAFAFYKCLNCM
jgi:hypothetical protein